MQYEPSAKTRPDTLPAVADKLDLREFGRTLVRRRHLILLITGIALLLTLVITLLSKPLYRATATLQIERETTKLVDVDFSGAGDIRDNRDFYQTQFELIRSRALAAAVIQQLALHAKLDTTSFSGQVKAWLGLEDTDPHSKQFALEERFLENLSVEPLKNSRLVAISFTATDAAQAAEIANAVVATFKNLNSERRVAAIQETNGYLEKSLQEARSKLELAEQQLNNFARENDIFRLEDEETTPTSLALKQLSEKLLNAQQQRIDLEQRVTAAELPPAQLNALTKELDNARSQETALRAEIEKVKATASQEQSKAMTYRNLKREVIANQEIYQNLQQRQKEINIASGVAANNIVLIDPAQPPLKKYKPKLSTNLLFGGLVGLFLGISAAFMREFLDDTVKNVKDLERITQLEVLGILPETADANSEQLARFSLSKPRSALAEAVRSLRTSLRFLHQDKATPITFITSSVPNEGKTTTVCNLASAMAATGQRVLLIDGDLRNPSLHKALSSNGKVGLANYLSGTVNAERLVQQTDVANLYLIPAGSPPDDPAELLSSARLPQLLNNASREFDHIIIDGSPVLGLADALILAAASTSTLLVVRAQYTRTAMLNNALTRLRRANAPLLGLILSRVDLGGSYGHEYGSYVYQADTNEQKTDSKLVSVLKKL